MVISNSERNSNLLFHKNIFFQYFEGIDKHEIGCAVLEGQDSEEDRPITVILPNWYGKVRMSMPAINFRYISVQGLPFLCLSVFYRRYRI